MTEQHEFGSPGWLAATAALIERWIADAGVDLTGVRYVSGEQFTDVPSRLNPAGAPTVGWTLTIRDGVVSTSTTPPPADADSDIVADWDGAEQMVHLVGDPDPAVVERRMALATELAAAGKIRRIERTPHPEVLADAFGEPFLRAVRDFTGPRQG